eukprot:COSAG06_NODE_3417_length_5373_cov_163.207622_5_plen_84_part_00
MVIQSVPTALEGRAVGLLSLAIGSNVPGTLVFAELAHRVGTYTALRVFSDRRADAPVLVSTAPAGHADCEGVKPSANECTIVH